MAVNDIENPEEGTPKSRKDIRRERRQMRSMNAQRAEVGAEPLYTKEEIREVGKPFKAQSSTFMTGTKDGTTYNDPSLLNKPDEIKQVEYIKYEPGGYSTNVKPMSKERFEKEKKEGRGAGYKDYDEYLKTVTEKYTVPSSTKSGTFSLDEYKQIEEGTPNGQALANTLKNTAINDDTKTFEQKKNLVDVANVAGKELETTNEQINQQAKQEINTVTGGDGKTAAGVMEKAPTQYDWTLSEGREYTPTSIDEINAQASQAKKKAPQLVIEKLGVQDYYPEIGRDIAVGNFSGSYAGSRTIFSGAGGLLPLGLYDARKRAIAAEIKRKEAIMDQIKEIPDIAKQFKTEFSQIYMNDFLAPWVNAYKDNPDGLMSNTDFLKDMAHYKSVAENFLKVDSDLRDFKKVLEPKDGEPAAWATPAMLEIQRKFLSGFLPGKTEEWLTGKKNISKLTETLQALPNGYKWMDKKVTDLFKDPMKVKRAITPKDGVEWTPELKDKINNLSQSVTDGSTDYETYLTIMKEYFDFNFSSMVDEWVNGSTLNALTDKEKEDLKKSLTIYAESQMPKESFIPTITRQNNDNAARYAADKRLQGQLEFIKMKREQFDTMIRQTPTNLLLDAAILNKKAGGNGSFKSTLPAGKANGLNPNQLKVDVFDANGKPVSLTAQQLKDAKDGTYYMKPGSDPIKGSDIPPVIYYQATEAEAYNTGGNNYSYRNSGVGYKYEQKSIEGALVTIQEPLKFNFYRPGEQIMQDGYRLGTTIATGDQFLGQPASEQTYKITERGSNAFFQSESEPNE